MEQDFRQKYIDEQKKQAELRRARLAKIGMGGAVSSKEAGSLRNDAPPKAPASAGRIAANAQRPSRSAPPVRGEVHRPTYNASHAHQNGTAPQPTQRGTAPQSVQRPNNGGYVQSQRAAQTVKSPSGRTGQNAQRQPGTQASYARPAVQKSRRTSGLDIDDSEIFKNSLSEEESRAMMFSLTGKAEKPGNGGRVDIVDIGRLRTAEKRRSTYTGLDSAKKSNAGKYIGRFFAVVGTAVAMLIVTVYTALLVVAYGPSETVRDLLVNSAMQASATKWAPYLVLPSSKVDEILAKSEEVVQDVVSIDDYSTDDAAPSEDEWASAVDGMLFEVVNGSTFKAYVLRVKDPSRVFVGTSTDDFANATAGVNVFQAAERYNAIACINAGEFLDNGGHGSGYAPLGLTYSKGECVFDDRSTKTFIGFTDDNKLIVRESMSRDEANELDIRDAVSFQTGNTLIERDGDNVKFYYADGNTGTSQRTAIGQSADGTVIMIVTDGRTASSLGATHNDMIDLMVSYGAVSAGMLDGGSSSMMYYRDYFNKYDYDYSKLDEYQKQGLVNNYKAFTEPRRIPTFFMVNPEG